MIVDCHTHVFQHWAGLCGHASQEIHWKYIQKNLTRPSAKVRRAKDGAPANAKALFREGDNTWAGLRDEARLRLGPYGRLEFTVDGDDYHIQYMPVALKELEAPPELQLAQMSYVGVDHSILQAGMSYGCMNDYNAFSQHLHPDKFTGFFHVDEPMADSSHWMQEVDRAHGTLGLRGLYYQLDGFSRYGFQWVFDDRRFDAFWEKIASLKIPVFFESSNVPNYDEPSYIANMTRLHGLLTRFPRVRFLLVMGPPVGFFAHRGRWRFPDEVATTYSRENLQVEVMFPVVWGGLWEYPYPEAQALIKDFRDRYGAHKLVWGSDMPNVERFCTYQQCLNYVLRYCDFLNAREKELILGGNAAELCGIGSR